jgi:hypothetical protein
MTFRAFDRRLEKPGISTFLPQKVGGVGALVSGREEDVDEDPCVVWLSEMLPS